MRWCLHVEAYHSPTLVSTYNPANSHSSSSDCAVVASTLQSRRRFLRFLQQLRLPPLRAGPRAPMEGWLTKRRDHMNLIWRACFSRSPAASVALSRAANAL